MLKIVDVGERKGESMNQDKRELSCEGCGMCPDCWAFESCEDVSVREDVEESEEEPF